MVGLPELREIPRRREVQIGRNNFNRLKSCSAEIIRDPASATLDIRLVFALGAHAGNAQEFAKLRQMLVA